MNNYKCVRLYCRVFIALCLWYEGHFHDIDNGRLAVELQQ